MNSSRYFITDISSKYGINEEFILHCVRSHWVIPTSSEEHFFDEEDIARIQLILELREVFGANDESIPIILHLLDQLYFLRWRVQESGKQFKKSA
jgi:chaperone modulatory protein CbpM